MCLRTGISISAEELGGMIQRQIDAVNQANQKVKKNSSEDGWISNNWFNNSDLIDSFADEFTGEDIGVLTEGISDSDEDVRDGYSRLIEFDNECGNTSEKEVWVPNNNIDYCAEALDKKEEKVETSLQLFRALLRNNDYQDVSRISFRTNWNENYPMLRVYTEEAAFSMFLKLFYNLYVEDEAAMALMSFAGPEHIEAIAQCHRLLRISDVKILKSISDDINLCYKVFRYAYDPSLATELVRFYKKGGQEELLFGADRAADVRSAIYNAQTVVTQTGHARSINKQKERVQDPVKRLDLFTGKVSTEQDIEDILKEYGVAFKAGSIILQDSNRRILFYKIVSAGLSWAEKRQFLAVLIFTDAIKLLPENIPNIISFNQFWMQVLAAACGMDIQMPKEVMRRVILTDESVNGSVHELYLDDFLFNTSMGKWLSGDRKVSALSRNQGLLIHYGDEITLRSYVCNPTSLEAACADSEFIIEDVRSVLLYNFTKCEKLYKEIFKQPIGIGVSDVISGSIQDILELDNVFAYAAINHDYLPIFRSNSMKMVLFSVRGFIRANVVITSVNFVSRFLFSLGVLKKRIVEKKGAFSDHPPVVCIRGKEIPEPFRKLSMRQFVYVLNELGVLLRRRNVCLMVTDDEEIILDV